MYRHMSKGSWTFSYQDQGLQLFDCIAEALKGISYAKLANLPPIVGLYSSFVPPLVYAVLGSSRDLAVGTVSIASLILGSMLRQEVSPSKDPLLFLQLAFSSTLFAGLFQASLILFDYIDCYFFFPE
ncbi:probable sulfate transporter 3.3 [Quercus lobata]|uniref:probable sulfate transporter 3.3 n=1 Tax=Quercus lobata TaxID=97700 RepID=UPI0012474F41|nr:probable sulfate transporter 3.3 [Quercus lobata]